MELKTYYEDKDIIVVCKPAGVSSQSSKDFEEDMVSLIKKHVKASANAAGSAASGKGGGAASGKGGEAAFGKRDTAGEPYVGVIHRLDKMVSGIMVYALNKEAAANLSAQVQKGSITKKYEAALLGVPKESKGEYVDYLVKDEVENISRVSGPKDKKAKEAKLRYKVIEKKYDGNRQTSKVAIELITGRHHQIRVQFASRGTPVLGDHKYGKADDGESQIQLRATELAFAHPKTKKVMTFRE